MTEGFGYGRKNNEGFTNLEDYHAQPVDILLMGSSHMEAGQVAQNKTTAALLNSKFNGANYVYNIGTSCHDLPHITNNLETAIQYYRPQKCVIIETGSIQIGIASLEDIISSRIHRLPSYDKGIVFRLQKIPYLRLLYKQYKSIQGNNEDELPEQVSDILDKEKYPELLDTVMQRLNKISSNSNIKLTIFYHPHLLLNKDGSASANTDTEYLELFKTACGNNGIYFIDMTGAFTEEYKRSHTLPHGFANTAVGAGHLNKNGHKIIAEELFRQINQVTTGSTI
jgi:hypothetical protein